jgi:UPF0271 protein
MMKLNCDMGESFGPWKMGSDAEIMPHIDMANIACGFHASDPVNMMQTVALAAQHGVTIGAHPGYPDLVGFGRRNMSCSTEEISALIIYQVAALQGVCRAQGVAVSYVKPHGALYNTMMRDDQVFLAIVKGVAAIDADLSLLALATGRAAHSRKLAAAHGVPIMFEAFCDRAYQDDGNLVPRSEKNAVLETEEAIENRIRELIVERKVTTATDHKIDIHADTICVHGDHSNALESIKQVRQFINHDL